MTSCDLVTFRTKLFNSTGPNGINIRHLNIPNDFPSDTLQTCTTLPSILTQYTSWETCNNHFLLKTKQRPQDWHKLPMYMIFITHC